ncbi:Hint domain-containing protein [Wenjunlia tyrosinilytica]|uniref:Hint domain-containing protein n=1 Tax=Wenjunlia tyrosinilytica TaxID=1544741 RepID=A0A917ZZ57_9ACTN|nr:hypothetical protein GCM10012280_71660 [Wenjunlia tyrosinilytica]
MTSSDPTGTRLIAGDLHNSGDWVDTNGGYHNGPEGPNTTYNPPPTPWAPPFSRGGVQGFYMGGTHHGGGGFRHWLTGASDSFYKESSNYLGGAVDLVTTQASDAYNCATFNGGCSNHLKNVFGTTFLMPFQTATAYATQSEEIYSDFASGNSDAAVGKLGFHTALFALGRGLGKAGKMGCRNSFLPKTPVLMADGTTKAIKDVKTGDEVLATDAKSGKTLGKEVTAEIIGKGKKHLVKVTLADGRPKRAAPASLTATYNHPFWVPSLERWVNATHPRAGQWLRTSAGTLVQIKAVKRWTATATVNNLTVADLHTYYVLAGATPVLVHNCGEAGEHVYRGIDWGHSKYDDALEGRAVPRGGEADAASHNGGNLDSPFTSWTDDYEGVALDAAELGNGPGIVMRHRRADIQDRLIKGPQDIYGESELLVEGVINGAEISINRGPWHLPGSG